MVEITNTEFKMGDLKFDGFTEDELETLGLFHEQVMKMKQCKVIKNDSLKCNVSFERTPNGFRTTVQAPDDEELGYILLRIRPCLLEKDRIFFNKIKNILAKRAINDVTRNYFKVLNKNYNFFLRSTAIEYSIDGKKYGLLDLFNAILNGELFHVRDEEPRKLVKQIEKDVPYWNKEALVNGIGSYFSWFIILDQVIEYHLADKLLRA